MSKSFMVMGGIGVLAGAVTYVTNTFVGGCLCVILPFLGAMVARSSDE